LTAGCISRIIRTEPQTSAMIAEAPQTTPVQAAVWNADRPQ
jgi:hypothetical protein